MNEKTLRKLIKLVEDSDIESLEIRRFFRTIRITKRANNHNGSSGGATAKLVEIPVASMANPLGLAADAAPPPQPIEAPPSNLVEIKAPMVGTLYRAPSPGAKPFVEVNQVVAPGDVVCIIEAMKLMNEIEAERGGTIVKILVEDAHPIEFGQALFLLDPAR